MTTLYIIYIISGAFLLSLAVITYLIIRQLKQVVHAGNQQCHAISSSVNVALKQAVDTKATAVLFKENRISDLPLTEPKRFNIEKLSRVGEFRVYVLVDKGLSEKYLFLQADNGSLIGLGNVEAS